MAHFDHQEERHAVIAEAQVWAGRMGVGDLTALLASQSLSEMLHTFEIVFGAGARSTLRV